MMDMIQRDKERKLLGTFFGEVVVVVKLEPSY